MLELFKPISLDVGKYTLPSPQIITNSCGDRIFIMKYKITLDNIITKFEKQLVFSKILLVAGGDVFSKTMEGLVLAGMICNQKDWDKLYNVTEEYSAEQMKYFTSLHTLMQL